MKQFSIAILALIFGFQIICFATPQKTLILNGANTVIFDQEITPTSAEQFTSGLIGKRTFLPVEETLYIVLVSPGGRAAYAPILAEFIFRIPNVAIICRACHSAASYIMCQTKVPRYVTKTSEMMVHEMRLDWITAAMVQNTTAIPDLISKSAQFNKVMANTMGIPIKKYEEKILNTEWNLGAAEIVKYNCANEIVKIKCDSYMSSLLPNTCKE